MCMHSNAELTDEQIKIEETERVKERQNTSKASAREIIKTEAAELPADFRAWALSVFKDHYMYYHKNEDGNIKGYCSCGAEVDLPGAKSGKYITCPACGATVRLRDDKYSHTCTEWHVLALLQKTSEGWMQRLFVAYKDTFYSCDKSTPRTRYRLNIYEDQREHLHRNGYYYKFHETPSGKWMSGRGKIHGQGWGKWTAESQYMDTYPNNLGALFADSEYKYSQLKTAAAKMRINPFTYLYDYLHYPQLEYLVKLGMYRFALDFLYWIDDSYDKKVRYGIDYDGKTLKEICGLENKQDIDYAVKNNLGSREVQAYHAVKKWSVGPSPEAIKFLLTLYDRSGLDFKYSFISNEKLFCYYRAVCEKSKKKYKPGDFLADYADYAGAAIQLRWDMSDTKIKTPHDFKYAHDVCMARYEELRKKREKTRKAREALGFKKLAKKYQQIFEYKDAKYQIIVPKTPEEIRAEGAAQANCVGTYANRVASGYCVILFLRKAEAPAEAFCTVEVQPDSFKIVQCRAKGNKSAPETAMRWMEKYIEKIKSAAEKEKAA